MEIREELRANKTTERLRMSDIQGKVDSLRRAVEFGEANGKSNLIVGLDVLRVLLGNGNQTLSIDELTDRFYEVKRQRNLLIAKYQQVTAKLNTVQCYCPVAIQDEIREMLIANAATLAGESASVGG